jgi:hypothetical protein
MKALLKNIPLILLAAFGTASCSYYVAPGGLPIPTTPADKPFPRRAPRDSFASVSVWKCLEGKYTGLELIDKSAEGRLNPGGKGKIYEFHVVDHVKTPPLPSINFDHPEGEEWWGYSFTMYTTDEDIITDCKVTKRFLQ